MPVTGKRIARYELEDRLGEGGFGSVYRARDPVLGRTVAIKVIRGEAMAFDAAARARFVREGRAVAALVHPNVVAVFDAGEADGIAFIVMEYVKGNSLRAHIGDPNVPMARRIGWLLDVARALAVSHRAGLVHRDIKPENVLVTEDNQVKVVDFGIARHVESSFDPTPLTQDGQLVGTPLYMAPEVMMGEVADAPADQFSWGVLAYELLAGRRPWGGNEGVLSLVQAVVKKPPDPFTPLKGEVPPEIVRVIERAIARDPAERFPSMEALVDVLGALASGQVPKSELRFELDPPSTAGSAVPPPRNTPDGARPSRSRGTYAVLAGLALLAGVLVWLVVGEMRSRSAHAQKAPPLPSQGAPAAPATFSIVDAPLPDGKAEAVAQYKSALRAFRQANWTDAGSALKKAVSIDPELGAAHVRLGYIETSSRFSDDLAREYRAALAVRDKLAPRDAALLDALQPLVSDPPNLAGFMAALRAVADRWPGDAEIQCLAAMQEESVGELDYAQAFVDRALADDPDYADAWQVRARLSMMKNQPDEARRAIDACIRVAPASTDCRLQLTWFDEAFGRCADAETAFKDALSLAPEEQSLPLGGVLRALDRPRGAVEEATRSGIERVPAAGRTFTGHYTMAALYVSYGEFDRALKELDDADASIRDNRDGDLHGRVATRRALLLLEMGDPQKAREVLRKYLDARAAWAAPRIDRDPLIFGIFAGDVKEALEKQASAPLPFRRFYWALGWNGVANDKATALRALADRPDVSPLAAYESHRFGAAAAEGRILLLAEKPAEAVPLLEATARHCSVFEEPLLVTQAQLWLGQAHEALGEKDAACDAYGAVIDRWGKATPRSVSQEEARRRSLALRCAPH